MNENQENVEKQPDLEVENIKRYKWVQDNAQKPEPQDVVLKTNEQPQEPKTEQKPMDCCQEARIWKIACITLAIGSLFIFASAIIAIFGG